MNVLLQGEQGLRVSVQSSNPVRYLRRHTFLPFQGYMEENILPNGWLGIWRSGGVFGSCPVGESTASVLVEIENVLITADGEKLEALATVSLPGKTTEGESNNDHRDFRAVVVNHPGGGLVFHVRRSFKNCRSLIRFTPSLTPSIPSFSPQGSPNSSIFNNSWTNPPSAASVDSLSLSEVESQLESLQWNIPLLDVHPVFQRHGGAKLTATALENVRYTDELNNNNTCTCALCFAHFPVRLFYKHMLPLLV